MIEDWNAYIDYLIEWADDHSDPKFKGCSPACFDEFCDCELQEYLE